MHIGQAAFDSVVVIGQSLMIQTEQVKDGGMKVVRRGDIFESFESEFISATIGYARLDARSRKPRTDEQARRHLNEQSENNRGIEKNFKHKKQQTALLLFFSSDGKRSTHDG